MGTGRRYVELQSHTLAHVCAYVKTMHPQNQSVPALTVLAYSRTPPCSILHLTTIQHRRNAGRNAALVSSCTRVRRGKLPTTHATFSPPYPAPTLPNPPKLVDPGSSPCPCPVLLTQSSTLSRSEALARYRCTWHFECDKLMEEKGGGRGGGEWR